MVSKDTTTKIRPKDMPNGILKSAHFITVKSPDNFPNIKHFLETLLKDIDIKIKNVGKSFSHTHLRNSKDFILHDAFMSYFIRKHLSNQLNVTLTDLHTEQILKRTDNYAIGIKPDVHKAIVKHYGIYKNHKTRAMEIIKSIKIVSLSKLIHFRKEQFKTEYYVNEDSLCEVVKYFQKLPYRMVELDARVHCKYFYAEADLLFDNEIMYEIRISRFESLAQNHKTINISQFFKMIIFAFGFFKKTRKLIKTFKIYNPLVGYEYSIQLNGIDFGLFEKVLQRDTDAYSFLEEFKSVNFSLDTSLFPGNQCSTAPSKQPQSNIPRKPKEQAKSDLVLYEHFDSFNISNSDDTQINKKLKKKTKGTDRIRKWERISLEETALLNNNRGKKMSKR